MFTDNEVKIHSWWRQLYLSLVSVIIVEEESRLSGRCIDDETRGLGSEGSESGATAAVDIVAAAVLAAAGFVADDAAAVVASVAVVDVVCTQGLL